MYLKDENEATDRLNSKDNLFKILNPDQSNRVSKIRVEREKQEEKLKKQARSVEVDEVLVPKKNHKKHGGHVPGLVRELAGAAAHFSDPKVVAAEFGLTPAQVKLYRNGETKRGVPNPQLEAAVNQSVQSLRSKIQKTQEDIHKKALKKLSRTLDYVNADKLGDAKITSIAATARHLAQVSEIMNGKKNEVEVEREQNIIFYSPKAKSEEDYDHIKIRSRDRR